MAEDDAADGDGFGFDDVFAQDSEDAFAEPEEIELVTGGDDIEEEPASWFDDEVRFSHERRVAEAYDELVQDDGEGEGEGEAVGSEFAAFDAELEQMDAEAETADAEWADLQADEPEHDENAWSEITEAISSVEADADLTLDATASDLTAEPLASEREDSLGEEDSFDDPVTVGDAAQDAADDGWAAPRSSKPSCVPKRSVRTRQSSLPN